MPRELDPLGNSLVFIQERTEDGKTVFEVVDRRSTTPRAQRFRGSFKTKVSASKLVEKLES